MTQIFGGKASEPETSQPVKKSPPAFGATIGGDPIGIP